MKWITKSNLNIGIFPVLDVIAPRLEFYFSSRTGGISPAPFNSLNLGTDLGDTRENVNQNRNILLNALNISSDNLALGEQTHSSNIRITNKGGRYKKSDGFITERTGLSIAISTADCYPVVIYSPPENAMAAIHVGRKGAAGGIISKTLRKMVDQFLINPENSISILGPGICWKCYQINRNIASKFEGKVIKKRKNKYYLDLPLFIKNELKRCGIKQRNIFSSGICTCCSPDLCFSYRRENITGRHWTLATIR
ncbi:MAG: peptidoglycan editing factor PgeF [Candidatus Krumholzibacteriota bacterium]|nr:peptidoglycan editing factor PgeF [Candidatus Krumholzibacteriota bacterium]